MMMLVPESLRARLLANGAARGDHAPVVKLFNPLGAATWLFSELDADGDILFGLCDLGFGCPELGSASLAEIVAIDLPLGLKIERDLYFTGVFPLTVYAEAARALGRITEDSARLQAAAASLAADRRAEHRNWIPPRVLLGRDG
jgi:hypothetical protein